MILKIKSNEYKLHFGIGFIRALDDKYYLTNTQGITFGQGLDKCIPSIMMRDPVVLSDVICAATAKDEVRPSQDDADEYVENLDEKELEKLFEEVMQELKKQNISGTKITNLEKTILEINQKTTQSEKKEITGKSMKTS